MEPDAQDMTDLDVIEALGIAQQAYDGCYYRGDLAECNRLSNLEWMLMERCKGGDELACITSNNVAAMKMAKQMEQNIG